MGIPTETPFDPEVSHRLVTRDDVLDRACQQMSVMRKSRRERRAVIKNERPVFRPLVDGFLEDLFVTPELEDFLFKFRKVDFVRDFLH